ncbi:MAG: ABC transporter permease [Candidatus Velthaea sp.]|jgi:NitT/TauT family transport system permease protein
MERLMRFAAPLSLLVIWELLVRTHALDPRFFPTPSSIVATFYQSVISGDLAVNTWATLQRIVIGFLLGAIPGTILGLAMGTNRLVRAYFDPVIALLYPIPKIAILPLLIFIFGIGEQSKYVLIAIGVFFLMAINTTTGVRQIENIYLDVARAYKLRPLTFYFRVLLPGALPNIFAGVKLSIGIAIVLTVAAEFIATKSGLGFAIFNAQQLLDIEGLYVALVAVSILGFVLTFGLDRLEHLMLPWRQDSRR